MFTLGVPTPPANGKDWGGLAYVPDPSQLTEQVIVPPLSEMCGKTLKVGLRLAVSPNPSVTMAVNCRNWGGPLNVPLRVSAFAASVVPGGSVPEIRL